MHTSGMRPSGNFFKAVSLQKDGKNGFTNNPKPNYRPKGQSTKNPSHRRGNV